MKTKIAAAVLLSLTVAALFIIFQAQAVARPQQGSSPSSDQSRSVWDGVYAEEQAERGHSLYHEKCENCHGASLTGESEAPPLAGAQFLSNWNGLTVGDLFERIRKSMPLNDPGNLTAQQIADILAYLLNFNQFPAGKAELPNNAELLKQIRIEATKPEPKPDHHDDKSEPNAALQDSSGAFWWLKDLRSKGLQGTALDVYFRNTQEVPLHGNQALPNCCGSSVFRTCASYSVRGSGGRQRRAAKTRRQARPEWNLADAERSQLRY